MTADVRAITVREPWASCIAAGHKLVENRASGTQWRGTLFIHTSQQLSDAAIFNPQVQRALRDRIDFTSASVVSMTRRFDLGAVIAVAELVDVHTAEDIPTLTGPPGTCCEPWGERVHGARQAKHLVLNNVRRLAQPVPARGALGLWKPTADLVERVSDELAKAVGR